MKQLYLSNRLPLLRNILIAWMAILPVHVYLATESDPAVSSATTASNTILKSSVSEEFRHGVHEKYLQYLAAKLDMQLEIVPMTYNRRLASLRDGNIDVMTGLRHTYETNDQFVYLQPYYATSQNSFFIRADGKTRLTDQTDLQGLTIAVTVDEKSHLQALENLGANVVVIGSLSQKILLLQKQRIDAFEHVESSALRQLEQKGLSEDIKLAEYKSDNVLKFHFALSSRSPLMSKKAAIEAVIAEGVARGDFIAIRNGHYVTN